MERKIITISREYGSGGRYIGEEVAKRLGIAYYDKKIIAQTAERTGNEGEKVRRIMELYHVSETEAKRQLKFVDKKRSTNYNYYTDRKWGVTQNYTLSMNSSELGYETCIEMICSLVKSRD